MIDSVDQLGRRVHLDHLPSRIVSLVPSQTELLFDLGLDREIVGVTKFCVHPDHARKTRKVIGGTKKFDFEEIAKLKPDLVIGNKEENYPEGIEFLQDRFPVWMSDIYNLEEALSMIAEVARITGREETGKELVQEIRSAFTKLQQIPPLRTLYLMWYNPIMGAASHTFIDSMIRTIGLTNVLAGRERYPELAEDVVKQLNPDLVLLSSEPFPFAQKHKEVLEKLLPKAKVILVDGEFFSWYGSRLKLAPNYVEQFRTMIVS